MLTLKYHLTEEEYFDYHYFTTWSAPAKKRYRIKYYSWVLIFYTLVAALYIFSKQAHNIWIDFSIFSSIGIVYILLVPYLIRRSVRVRVKDILAEPENAHVLSAAEVILMDSGILDKDTVSESKYDWDAIVRKAETPNSYYLYTNSYHAIVIPKRVLNNPKDREELNRLFNEYLPLATAVQ